MNGDHNVADPLVGDIHYPFEHVTRIFIDKVVLPGITDQRQQFIAVFRFPVKSWLSNREKILLLFTVSLLCELSSLMASFGFSC